jgi:hypothetical protein
MILRRFVSILAEAGYILGLLALLEARPRTILQAALQVHTAAIPSLKRGGKGWLDDNRATMLGGDGINLPRRLPEGPYQVWCIFFTKPPQRPFRQIRRQPGDGNVCRIPYNGK